MPGSRRETGRSGQGGPLEGLRTIYGSMRKRLRERPDPPGVHPVPGAAPG
ncbi:hypothetical protein JCM13210_01030 [Thermaerobacter litoralis]